MKTKEQATHIQLAYLKLPGWTGSLPETKVAVENGTEVTGADTYLVSSLSYLGHPDLVILPDTEDPITALTWLRESGLEAALKELSEEEVPILGIGGGFLLLGEILRQEPDTGENGSEAAQSDKQAFRGLGFLPLASVCKPSCARRPVPVTGAFTDTEGIFSELQGLPFSGIDTQAGTVTVNRENGLMDTARLFHGHLEICRSFSYIQNTEEAKKGGLFKQMRADGYSRGNCYGTMVDGGLSCKPVLACIRNALLAARS